MLHLLADVALVAAACGCLAFVLLYQGLTSGRWRSTAYGRNVMAFMGIALVLLTIGVVREFVDVLDGYLDVIRLAGFTVVALIVWQRVALLVRAQRGPDPQHPEHDDQEDDHDHQPA